MTVRGLAKPTALAIVLALIALVLITAPGPVGPTAAKSGATGAGGKAVAHFAGGKRIGGAIAKKAPKAQLSRLNHGAGEPTIAFNKKGDAFIPAAEIALRNTVDVLRTQDNGKTWKNVSPNLGGQNTHATTLDPYVWNDERTGRIYTIDLTVACSILSWTDDAGKSWTTNPLACGVPVNDHQTLFGGAPAIDRPAQPYESVLYYCWNNVASSYCSKSIDGGLTFTATGSPAYEGAGDEGFCGGLHGHGVVGPDGTVFLPREYCNRAYVAISKDEGLTWTRVKVAKMETSGGSDTSVAVDKAGNIYYMFVGGDDRLPYLVVSKNDGKSWSKPMMVGAPGLREANLPSIDALGAGKIAFSYMGSENVKLKKDGKEVTRDYTTATWNGYIGMAANATSKKPVFYTGTVNNKRDPIYRQQCGPGRCGAVFDFIDVEIAPDGTPWAPFVDACVTICAQGAASNDGDEGIAGRLVGGPKLK
jgi:hypothetical protein